MEHQHERDRNLNRGRGEFFDHAVLLTLCSVVAIFSCPFLFFFFSSWSDPARSDDLYS